MPRLPYMKWYPQDCDSDEVVKSMSDDEFGFYMRCLNHSWINRGIPSDLEEMADVMCRPIKYVQRVWKKVGRKWQQDPTDPARLINPKQEELRSEAKLKSDKARNAVRNRYERNADVDHLCSVREQDVTPRVYESESISPVVDISSKTQKTNCPVHGERFPEWWDLWASFMGTNHHNAAAQAWLSVVTPDLEDAVFECTRSYRDSRTGSGGYNPENFLFDQARDSFRARWPPPRAKPESKDEQRQKALNRLMASNLERMSDGKRATKEIHTTRS